jgi:hypothetical protein
MWGSDTNFSNFPNKDPRPIQISCRFFTGWKNDWYIYTNQVRGINWSSLHLTLYYGSSTVKFSTIPCRWFFYKHAEWAGLLSCATLMRHRFRELPLDYQVQKHNKFYIGMLTTIALLLFLRTIIRKNCIHDTVKITYKESFCLWLKELANVHKDILNKRGYWNIFITGQFIIHSF